MQKIKAKIKKTKLFNAYLYANSVGFGVMFANFLFQRVFRIDPCIHNKNYTSRLIAGNKLKIENNCFEVRKSLSVSGGCYFQAMHGITIGKNTIWSFNVTMATSTHDVNDYRLENTEGSGPIIIGNDCWIGASVTILPKVTLGPRTIVGANSVVTKSFADGNVVIAGCPARVIKAL